MRRGGGPPWWAVVVAAAATTATAGCNALLGIDPLRYQAPGVDGGFPGDGAAGSDRAGDRGGTDTPSSTVTEACNRYIDRYCGWQDRCTEGQFPMDFCLTYFHGSCAYGWYELPGSRVTPAVLDACAEGASTATCTGTPCTLPLGSTANGLPCISYLQCASGLCTGGSSACGVCAPSSLRKLGESCDAPGQYCDAGTACVGAVCVRAAALNESCSAATPCVRAADHMLVCTNGRCVTVGEAGQPCNPPELVNGPCYPGFTCDTGTNLCVAINYVTVKLGESCKQVAGAVVQCATGTYCPCEDASNPNPVCRAYPGPGESCSDSFRPCGALQSCAAGLNCTGGSCAYPPPVGPPPVCAR